MSRRSRGGSQFGGLWRGSVLALGSISSSLHAQADAVDGEEPAQSERAKAHGCQKAGRPDESGRSQDNGEDNDPGSGQPVEGFGDGWFIRKSLYQEASINRL